jgi:hypothetical protein
MHGGRKRSAAGLHVTPRCRDVMEARRHERRSGGARCAAQRARRAHVRGVGAAGCCEQRMCSAAAPHAASRCPAVLGLRRRAWRGTPQRCIGQCKQRNQARGSQQQGVLARNKRHTVVACAPLLPSSAAGCCSSSSSRVSSSTASAPPSAHSADGIRTEHSHAHAHTSRTHANPTCAVARCAVDVSPARAAIVVVCGICCAASCTRIGVTALRARRAQCQKWDGASKHVAGRARKSGSRTSATPVLPGAAQWRCSKTQASSAAGLRRSDEASAAPAREEAMAAAGPKLLPVGTVPGAHRTHADSAGARAASASRLVAQAGFCVLPVLRCLRCTLTPGCGDVAQPGHAGRAGSVSKRVPQRAGAAARAAAQWWAAAWRAVARLRPTVCAR